MAYEYKHLSLNERDDMLVATMVAQERDLFMHIVNLERFEAIIAAAGTASPFTTRIAEEIPVVRSRIAEVSAIIAALEPQMPPPLRADAAAARLKARETATRPA